MIRKLLLIALLAAAVGAGWEIWAKGKMEAWKKEKVTAMIESRLTRVEGKIKESLEEKVGALARQAPALKPLVRASSPATEGTPQAKVTLEIHQHEIETFLTGEQGIEHPKVAISQDGIVVEGTVKLLKVTLPVRLEASAEIRDGSKIALVPKSLSVSGKRLSAEEIAELMEGGALLIETNLAGITLTEITLRPGKAVLSGHLDREG